MATTSITATDSPHQQALGAQWTDYKRAANSRSHSTTSLPLSNDSSPSMARRVSSSTITKKIKAKRARGSARPSTAPGKTPPASPNHAQAPPPPPPSAFSGKTGWLKRITSLRSSSTLALHDKDAPSTTEDTLPAPSHSVLSKDSYDVDKFGRDGRYPESDYEDVSSTFTKLSRSKRSSVAFDERVGRDGEGGAGGERLYDFLQALEIAPSGQAYTQPKPRPKGSVPKQAPPLIDLTGGVYMRRSVNRNSGVSPIRPSHPPPIAPVVASSSSTDSSATSATASTFTASTLVDSPPRRSASETSSSRQGNDSPCSPSTPPPALTKTNTDHVEAQITEGSAPAPVPVVLPITLKSKLTVRKRAPSPPLQTNHVPSATVATSPPASPLPRSVSSPAVPDSSLQEQQQREQEAEEERRRNALAELVKESLAQLRTPPTALYSSTSDPGLCLTWTTRPKVTLRALPSSPEMLNDVATPKRTSPSPNPSSPASTATEKPAPASPSSPRFTETSATPEPLTPPSNSRAPNRNSDSAFTDSASIYEKTLAAISPEDIHISQRTLLEPVVRKASDVSLKQLFKQLDQTEHSSEAENGARLKKRSLNGITGAVVGGVSASVGKKKIPKRPATAGAAVDLTKVKTPAASPVLSGTSTPISGTLGPATARTAALSLQSAASTSRTPLSTRRPRTATEPNQPQRLGRAVTVVERANAGKSLNMDWDRHGNPWDDPTFRDEGSVFRDPSSSVPRSRAKSEAPPPVASALALGLAVKKEGKKSSLKRPSTADSTLKGLLKKKSSQALSLRSEQQQPAAPPVPPTPAPVAAPLPPPPSEFSGSFRRSLTMRSKNTAQDKELPLPPPPPPPADVPAAVDASEVPATSTDPSPSSFESDRMLTMRDIYEASLIPVWDKEGHKVAFGKLFEDQVTIVIFIRHFWCPMCQDYMKSIVKELEPGRLAQARVKLIVIGCGDPAMIRSYNDKIVKSPFEMYTDPKLILFSALGMTLKTTDGGPEERKGGYVKHGTFMGTLNVIGRALMSMAPNVLVKKGGDIKQLGGEFILGPGLRCRFAHRMSTTRNHAPIREVAINAGVQLSQSKFTLFRTPSQEEEWTARRKGLTKKKSVRPSSGADFLKRPPTAHVSLAVCGGDDGACPVRTNTLVGTI
ncbi:hypothetical protein FS837_000716 [Tulasnella sp. UAMH 9824]|nr:hypothetical protein FS837_000716 [Tulasnella sp. UAMH 9824]